MFKFILLLSLICLSNQTAVQDAFRKYEIVPNDLIPVAPERLLKVTYANNLEVYLGNNLKVSEVKDDPQVSWVAQEKDLYTLIMTDPDAPSRKDPVFREIKHWLIVNIKGSKISTGRVIADYRGSNPPSGSGLHRYIFLVYKQLGPINDDLPMAAKDSRNGRVGFKTQDFASKYNLGVPMFGNFFQAQFENVNKTV